MTTDSVVQAEVIGPSNRQFVDSMKFRLAAQVGTRSWRQCLQRVANQLEGGQSLEEALVCDSRTPRELAVLLHEALGVRDPGRFILEAVRVRHRMRHSWRSFISACLYPVFLSVFALTIGILFAFCLRFMVDLDWIDEFGLTGMEYIQLQVEDQFHSAIGLGVIAVWIGLMMLLIYYLGPPWAWLSVVGGFIVVGKPLRWLCLQEYLERLRLCLAQNTNPADAVEAAARSLQHSRQALAAKRVAEDVDRGIPLGRALGNSLLSDGLCRPSLLLLDDQGHDLEASLRRTIDLLASLAQQRLRTLTNVLPLVALAFVVSIIWNSIASYFMLMVPLMSILTSLA